jgi:hypothetical protein
MGRSRGGLTCKIHAVVDTNGLPVRLALTAGEAHDNRLDHDPGLALLELDWPRSDTLLLLDRLLFPIDLDPSLDHPDDVWVTELEQYRRQARVGCFTE